MHIPKITELLEVFKWRASRFTVSLQMSHGFVITIIN